MSSVAAVAACAGEASNEVGDEGSGGRRSGPTVTAGASGTATEGSGGRESVDAGSDAASIPQPDAGLIPPDDPACADDDRPREPGSVCIGEVVGSVVDSDGASPPEGFGVSVCGPVCYVSHTEADGTFVVPIGQYIVPERYSALPHGRPLIAGYYFGLSAEAAGPTVDVGTLQIVSMPEEGVPIDLDGAAAQSLTSGGVTLEIPAGITTHLEFDDFAAGELGSQFRARAVDVENVGGFVPDNISALYALGPFEASFENAGGEQVDARLVFENSAALEAGTAVELLALGSYLYPEWVAPARFEVVARGHVSGDGARVELDSNEGFTYLTWVGIRPRSEP